MSYALAFTKRAVRELGELDTWLQEEVLDQLDELAMRQPLPGARSQRALVHDFVRGREDRRHYVFITYYYDLTRELLRVRAIGFHKHPAS